MTQEMAGGLRVALPGSLGLITPYVLQEQEDWFEDEVHFVRGFLRPGMRAVDIGANYGVYALSMAQAVGGAGRVWAFEPASATCGFLRESIALNGLANLTLVQAALSERPGHARLYLHGNSELNSLAPGDLPAQGAEEVEVRTLDQAAEELRWEVVDFVKLDAEGEECRILRGGERFFREQSPLVMFELMHGAQVNTPLIGQFAALGYQAYRLLPGLGILAPFDPGEARDPFQLNLFCCKPDAALRLEGRGVLATAADGESALRSRIPGVWRAALGALPFAAALQGSWEGGGAGLAERQPYFDALDLYLLSRDPRVCARLRYGALLESLRLLELASRASATAGRLSSYSRALFAAGWRSRGLQIITRMSRECEAGRFPDADEPFLPPSERFEQVPMGGRPADWFAASLLEQMELLGRWSSYYTPAESALRLQRIRELGFITPELERRARMAAQCALTR